MKRNPPVPAAAAAPAAAIAPEDFPIAWRVAFGVLVLLLLLLIWFPLARINAHYTITMNEGIPTDARQPLSYPAVKKSAHGKLKLTPPMQVVGLERWGML